MRRGAFGSRSARILSATSDPPDSNEALETLVYCGTWVDEREVVFVGDAQLSGLDACIDTIRGRAGKYGPVFCWRLRWEWEQQDHSPAWVFYGRAPS